MKSKILKSVWMSALATSCLVISACQTPHAATQNAPNMFGNAQNTAAAQQMANYRPAPQQAAQPFANTVPSNTVPSNSAQSNPMIQRSFGGPSQASFASASSPMMPTGSSVVQASLSSPAQAQTGVALASQNSLSDRTQMQNAIHFGDQQSSQGKVAPATMQVPVAQTTRPTQNVVQAAPSGCQCCPPQSHLSQDCPTVPSFDCPPEATSNMTGPDCYTVPAPCYPPGYIAPRGPSWQIPPFVHTKKSSPDEYICDGGDRNAITKIAEDFAINGLDMEDTVAHFDTLDGERIVQPSNKVCIYAPRFGAVRKVYGIALNKDAAHLAGTGSKTIVENQQKNQITNANVQNIETHRHVGRTNASTFEERMGTVVAGQRLTAEGFKNKFLPFEDLSLVRFGKLDQNDKARLATSMLKARSWDHGQGAEVFIKENSPSNVQGGQKAMEASVVERPPGVPHVRIVKLASKQDALPGEIVEFTLRFDNLGIRKVGNVTIIDNLTPRLEYVEGSAECSLEANFLTTENEGESLLLRWEIKDPIEPLKGGVIRFKCKVR